MSRGGRRAGDGDGPAIDSPPADEASPTDKASAPLESKPESKAVAPHAKLTDDDGWGDAARAAGAKSARPETDDDGWTSAAAATMPEMTTEMTSPVRPEPPPQPQPPAEVEAGPAPAPAVTTDDRAIDDNEGWADVAPEGPADSASVTTIASSAPPLAPDLAVTSGVSRSTASAELLDALEVKPKGAERESVRVKKPRKSKPRRKKPRSRRASMLLFGFIAISVATIGLVGMGYLNSSTYHFVCGDEQITARQGRFFPPMGTEQLSWLPIEILDQDRECQDEELDSEEQLKVRYRKELFDTAEGWLKSHWPAKEQDNRAGHIRLHLADPVYIAPFRENLEIVDAQLQEAKKLGRSSKSFKERVTRRLGDVEFWLGQIEIQEALERLEKASDHFENSIQRKPAITSDWNAWNDHMARLKKELQAGPPALRPESPAEQSDRDAASGQEARPVKSNGDASSAGPRDSDATSGTSAPRTGPQGKGEPGSESGTDHAVENIDDSGDDDPGEGTVI